MRPRLLLFGVLAAVESVAALVILLVIPRDAKNAWMLGYSPSRWGLLFTVTGIAMASMWLTYEVRKGRQWGQKFTELTERALYNQRLLYVLTICACAIVFLGLVWIAAWIYLPEESAYHAYITRFAALVLLVSAISAQLIWLLKSELTRRVVRIAYQIAGFIIVLGLSFNYAARMVGEVRHVLRSPERGFYLADDSGQFYRIAEEFSGSGLEMAYVREGLAHRQPLYPFLLAIPLKLAGGEIVPLVMVNVSIAVMLLLAVYVCVRWVTGSTLAGVIAVFFIVTDEFLFVNITKSFMSEPLFILLAFLTSVCFMQYVVKKEDRYLYGMAIFAGLSYLTRTNGLFLMLACVCVLLCYDVYGARRKGEGGQGLAKKYARVAIILVVVTLPSWLPRVVYHGNPFYHEYLSNYLWVDTFEEGHLFGPPRYDMQDYFASHSLRDVIGRIVHGMRSVYVDTIVRSRWPVSALIVLGLVFSLISKQPAYILLAVFMFVQMMPIVWTDLSNPTERIPYSSLLPFAVIYLGLFVSFSSEALKRVGARVMAGKGNMGLETHE